MHVSELVCHETVCYSMIRYKSCEVRNKLCTVAFLFSHFNFTSRVLFENNSPRKIFTLEWVVNVWYYVAINFALWLVLLGQWNVWSYGSSPCNSLGRDKRCTNKLWPGNFLVNGHLKDRGEMWRTLLKWT
jgi:hypothetical protein